MPSGGEAWVLQKVLGCCCGPRGALVSLIFRGTVHAPQLYHTMSRKGLNDNDDRMEIQATKGVEIYPTFDSMGLKETLLRGIYAYGT